VFFGGGTPALTPPAQLEQILKALDRAYGIASDAEISIEADPGCFTTAQLRSYKALGVTRFSVGVQSFDEALLEVCGRAHGVADVYRAIEAVYAADVPTWSLDLMSGLPGLTETGWETTLAVALDAAPPHISVYDLQIEDHTPFAKQYRPGHAPLPSEEAAAAMYGVASGMLRGAGYEHYEISNYAKSEHQCAHNMTYWKGQPYYAYGMGAASYLQGRRFARPRRVGAYYTWLEELEAAVAEAGGRPVFPGLEAAVESAEDRLTDTIMLRLRLGDGLDLKALAKDFEDGGEVADVVVDSLVEHVQRGHVEVEYEEESRTGRKDAVRVRLTDPEGFVVSNDVISDVFVALDEARSS
jgi:putative oxygen-independent coproporphyrinogen III oxidase